MDSYDFKSQISAYILGHIFEQSISDIENLKNQKVTKRKKHGVFYTPEYITDYICRNTIIASISKKKSTTVVELVNEFTGNLDSLEQKIENIKILDPACGSGAFLVKAAQTLLEIDMEIQSKKRGAINQNQMTEYTIEREIIKIVERNIFGIDVNEESNEITKLSLFLEMTSTRKKLPDLSKNILNGNSIIDTKPYSSNPFNWNEKFKKIIDEGGFDIIIGNPPYIPTELMEDYEKQFYSNHFKGIFRKYDTSVLFIENCLNYLKPNGYLGFIVPLTWQTGYNYKKFRKLIFYNKGIKLANLINLPFDVFQDPYVDTGIVVFEKTEKIGEFYAYQYPKNEKINNINDKLGEAIRFERISKQPDLKVLPSNIIYDRLDKIDTNFEQLGHITKSTQGIVTSKYSISNTKKTNMHVPFLLEADANRYRLQIRKKGFIDHTKISRIAGLYIEPKIMIRRIINRQNRLMAFYDNSGIVTNKDYNPFKIVTSNYDIFYILGILNSKFFSYLYYFKSAIAQKDDYRQTTLSEIRKLPIAKIDKKMQKNISKRAKKITKLTSDYFEQKDKVLRRVSENFQIKVTKKLSDIVNTEFHEFKLEIEIQTKKKLSL